MSIQKLLAFAKEQGIVLLENEPLCDHTSFRIGGPARLFAMPKTVEQLAHLLQFAAQNGLKYAVIGNGSNLLAPDEGLFPQYAGGRYDMDGAAFIVSRGLAKESTWVPRLFNPPELVLVDVT